MFGFLGFILIFILMIVLLGLAFIGNILRAIFGLGRRAPKRYTDSQQTTSGSYTGSTQGTSASSTPNKKKIFGDDEGEYVEYEEVP